VVNVALQGQYAPNGTAVAPGSEAEEATSDRDWFFSRWFDRRRPQPSQPPAPAGSSDANLPQQTVIRGQNTYNPGMGTAVPRFEPSGSAATRVTQPNPPPAPPRPYDPAAEAYPANPPYTPPATDPYASTPTNPPAAAPGQPYQVQPRPSYGAPSPPAPYVPNEPSPEGYPAATAPPQDGLFRPDSPFLTAPGDAELTRPLPLRVVAEETQTGRLMFGVGINSDAGLVGSVIIDEQNFDWRRVPRSWAEFRNATAFRGAGQRLRLEAVPGTEVQRYMASFQEPYLFNTSVSLGLSGYYYDRRYFEWDEQRMGGRFSLGYQFTHDLTGSLAFRAARITIHDVIDDTLPPLAEVEGDNSLYGLGFTLKHDTRDNAFLATEGHLLQGTVEQVTGTYDYTRVELEWQRYFLIHERPDGSGRHVLQMKSRFAWTGDDTPIYDHYYAGGFSTIRGFDFRGASPRLSGIAVGGHVMLLNSVQYVFPITADDMVRGVVFLDTGTVQPDFDNWDDKYRLSPGFGLRVTIPAMGPAPIALDFAFPIRDNPGDEERVFAFFVGMNR